MKRDVDLKTYLEDLKMTEYLLNKHGIDKAARILGVHTTTVKRRVNRLKDYKAAICVPRKENETN